jgi:hypothetical protein
MAHGNDEFDMLKEVPGIDVAEIEKQINGGGSSAGAGAAAGDDLGNKGPGSAAGGGTNGGSSSGGTNGNEGGSNEAATGILKEIFGDQFTTVEDLKTKNIPTILKEYPELRQQVQTLSGQNQDLTGKLAAKPKTHFANDNLAMYNEFVRETGIDNSEVFNRLKGAELTNMPDMDVLVLQRILENPRLIGSEDKLRMHLENKYNIDPNKVDAAEVEVNKIGLVDDAEKARKTILATKAKIKMPELSNESETAPVKWTEAEQTTATKQWSVACSAIDEKLSKIAIVLPKTKDPIVTFEVPEDFRKATMKETIETLINNQQEVNKENISTVAGNIYYRYIAENIGLIAHSIFEKVRSMTDEERLKIYHNPTPLGNTGGSAQPGGTDTPEMRAQKAFDEEMNRL